MLSAPTSIIQLHLRWRVIGSQVYGEEPAGVEPENQAIFVFFISLFLYGGSVGRFPVLFATK